MYLVRVYVSFSGVYFWSLKLFIILHRTGRPPKGTATAAATALMRATKNHGEGSTSAAKVRFQGGRDMDRDTPNVQDS